MINIDGKKVLFNDIEIIVGNDNSTFDNIYNILSDNIVALHKPDKKGNGDLTISDKFYNLKYTDVTFNFEQYILTSVDITPLWAYIEEENDDKLKLIEDLISILFKIDSTSIKMVSNVSASKCDDIYKITIH